jgi:hypothetical protein
VKVLDAWDRPGSQYSVFRQIASPSQNPPADPYGGRPENVTREIFTDIVSIIEKAHVIPDATV